MKKEILYLSQEDVLAAGGRDMVRCIECVEEALRIHSRGDLVIPPKSVVSWGDHQSEITQGRINAMPGYLGGSVKMMGIKWMGSNPPNPKRYNLPRASGILILNDPETKLPLAIMDNTVVSAMRTGAVGGIAAKYLARKDSEVMGVIGAGIINRAQALAVKTVLPELKRILVYDVVAENAQSWCREVSELLEIACQPVEFAEKVIRDSDLFVSATTAWEPIIKRDWIRAGQTYVHMAGYEDEIDVVERADKLVVDDWNQILHRGNQTIALAYKAGKIGTEDIHAEIGQVISGERSGRQDDREFIYFNAVGMMIEDIAFASWILKQAKKKGIGTQIPLWKDGKWI
jgi:ornithine cyclodeaminase